MLCKQEDELFIANLSQKEEYKVLFLHLSPSGSEDESGLHPYDDGGVA